MNIVSPVKDYTTLSKNIEKLINDNELRHKIALNGVKTSKDYSWEEAYKKFKEIIL